MLEKRIKLKENNLVNLLTSLYTDAQMAINGTWDSTYDKSGFIDQQILIDEFCKDNNIELVVSQKSKYADSNIIYNLYETENS